MNIIWHSNRRLLIKVVGRTLHLHKLFENAPTPVWDAIHSFAKRGDKDSRQIIRQMARLYFENVKEPPVPLVARGKVYDLQEIFDRLKPEDLTDVTIGWGKMGRGVRSIRYGSFDPARRQIRVHPKLDSEEVPLYFIEYIVYHELLHALIPVEMGDDGRCKIHSPEFKRREKLFPKYKEAIAWQGTVNGRT